MTRTALIGAQVFDGTQLHDGQAVLVEGDTARHLRLEALPEDVERIALAGGVICPGLVDLQVNGGGGVMVGDAPTAEGIARIIAAHRAGGTRWLMPTLITDRPEVTRAAIDAVASAHEAGQKGLLGLHLEGPHLDPAKAGAHDPKLIRPMGDEDLTELLVAAERLPNLKVTLAPEAATPAQIAALSQAGVIVSLGHSGADYDTAMRAIEAGARCATHLFNAMSGLDSRAPGLVGAALDSGISAGLIADGVHVHPAAMRAALKAKTGPGEIFLISDAMACAGTTVTEFDLGARRVQRQNGRLSLSDGTLAGADLTLARAVQVLVETIGENLAQALGRATRLPAALLREDFGAGAWSTDLDGLIYMDANYTVSGLEELLAAGH